MRRRHQHGGSGSALIAGAALLIGGAVSPAHAGPSRGAGIPVYTWTDASGTTHFSDKPPAQGAAKKLMLPKPAPPDQTVLAAQHAWLRQLNRDTQRDLAQAAARRRAARQQTSERAPRYVESSVQYVPVFVPGYRRRHHHRRDADDFRRHSKRYGTSTVRFPASALPSSFPDPLASSFPGLPSSSFPEARNASPMPPRR